MDNRFSQDKAAHQTYAFAMDGRNMQNGNVEAVCNHCGGHLKTYYCEDRLYLVRCLECGIAALARAKEPQEAACKTIGGIPGWNWRNFK